MPSEKQTSSTRANGGISTIGNTADNMKPTAKPQPSAATETFISPVAGARVTSPYGWRKHPISGVRRFHNGVDLAAAEGTPQVAPKGGVVTFAGPSGNGGGTMVVIKHDDGTVSRLLHVQETLVEPGQRVEQGQAVALTGSTGAVTGPHVHWEIRRGNISLTNNPKGENLPSVDPGPYVGNGNNRRRSKEVNKNQDNVPYESGATSGQQNGNGSMSIVQRKYEAILNELQTRGVKAASLPIAIATVASKIEPDPLKAAEIVSCMPGMTPAEAQGLVKQVNQQQVAAV